jgi:hypothetical protein
MDSRARKLWGWQAEKSGGLRDALHLLAEAADRPPDDGDRPPASTLPGRKRKPLPGQLDLFAEDSRET